MVKNIKAFTLVELIVVITILAVLGTIAFLSFQGYSSDSRNSVRISDLKLLESSLGVYEVGTGKFPLPDNGTGITYSGGLLWTQGYFGEKVFNNIGTVSKIPLDPKYLRKYSYSTTSNHTKFQLGGISEGSYFQNADFSSYILGNFNYKTIGIKNGNICSLISSPSIIINNIPNLGELIVGDNYGFVYADGTNLLPGFLGLLTNTVPNIDFEIKDLSNGCTLSSIDELNLYISKLSLLYQQLVASNIYNEVIYDFNTTSFKRGIVDELLDNGITISDDLIEIIMNPSSGNIFRDSFNGANLIDITNLHTPDTYGSWVGSNTYIIDSNRLTKTINSSGLVSPIPVLPVTSIDRIVLFDITDFAGGDIFLYTNYSDINNYQGVQLNTNGYIRMKMLGGVLSEYDNVAISISNNSSIEFSVIGERIRLVINDINQGDIIDTPLITNSNISLNMSNGSIIDNFTLIYK